MRKNLITLRWIKTNNISWCQVWEDVELFFRMNCIGMKFITILLYSYRKMWWPCMWNVLAFNMQGKGATKCFSQVWWFMDNNKFGTFTTWMNWGGIETIWKGVLINAIWCDHKICSYVQANDFHIIFLSRQVGWTLGPFC